MIVWMASYPRSGNTFFRVVLNTVFGIKTYSIYNDKSDIGADKDTSKIVGHEFLPEDFNLSLARKEKRVYYIKTHELFDERIDTKDKIIYLIRDGRESTLSFMKYINMYTQETPSLLDVINGDTFVGRWGEHILSWDPQNRKNTLVIKFEKLVQEPDKFIGTLSHFLKLVPIGKKIPTFQELQIMNPKFFRSGKVDSWKQTYTYEEHGLFWLLNGSVMHDYGYDTDKPLIDITVLSNSFRNFIYQRDTRHDLSFSQNYSKFYSKIERLKTLSFSFVIYGHGTIGKTIKALMPEQIIAFVDQKSDLISKNIIKGRVYTPANLPNMQYDKILISVLGREDEIIKYLVEGLHVDKDKIVTFDI